MSADTVTAPEPVAPQRPRTSRLAGARGRLQAIPRGFWACFVIAFVNACVWAVVTPSFQVPDEVAHAGYVQYFAETGRIPRPMDTTAGHFDLSQDESLAEHGVPFSYQGTPNWDPANDRATQKALGQPLDRKHEAGAGAAAPYPPLYYVLEAVPYKLASGGTFFDRLLAMRLFSALFMGLTAGFCFLFARELVPSAPWAALAAGLAVAFQPLAAFVSGGVNPEALLYAAGAALFYAVARAFRRGLTPRTGAAIGAALAVGLLSKGTALGFVPAIALALALLIWRTPAGTRRTALKGAAFATLIAAVPYLGWLALSALAFDRPAAAATAGLAHAPAQIPLTTQASFVWQLYLPKLWFMQPLVHNGVVHNIWFNGFFGRLGYSSFEFPYWVSNIGWYVVRVLGVLALVALVRGRRALLRRWPEGLAYTAMAVAVMALVGFAAFRLGLTGGWNAVQARYLLPLLAAYGALIALAVRAGGRRFGPAIAAVVVTLAGVHGFAAIMLTLGRYYS